MMTNKNEKTKKVQSKLSFMDRFFTPSASKQTEQTKENTTELKNSTSHSNVNNKDLLLFPDATSDIEVDTTLKNTTEAVASGSDSSATDTNIEGIELPLLTTS